MRDIQSIITVLSTDEKQEFLLLLSRRTRRRDIKSIKLFKLINTGKTHDLDIQLYGKPAKNAYHGLCKRLQDSLIDFVASKSFSGQTSEEIDQLKKLLASRIFFEHKQYTIAFKTLAKSEKEAIKTNAYAILNEIYHTKIQYAHLNPNLNILEIIAASEKNMLRVQQEFQLNNAYAVIKENIRENTNEVNTIIKDAFSRFKIEINDTLTFKSLYQLMEITATSAKLQSDYYTISPFMMKIYKLLLAKGSVADKHRYYHIKILNLMAITSFRNKDFAESVKFVSIMEGEMERNSGIFKKAFISELAIIKALNYNYTGEPKKALALLSLVKDNSINSRLIWVMCSFQQGDFNEAYKVFNTFTHSDAWYEKKMGWVWMLKKNILELLILIELDYYDLVLSRIQRFKRIFFIRLKQLGEHRVIAFIQLVNTYHENPKEVTSIEFFDQVENSFEWVGAAQEDVFVMSFYAWLKAKMEGENIYDITLKLVGRNR